MARASFDLGFPLTPVQLPIIQNDLRGAQNDLRAIDAAALRAPQEAVVEGGIQLQAIDAAITKRANKRVLNAYNALQSLDQAVLAPTLATIETARSTLAVLDGAAGGPPPAPAVCTHAYLILRWPASQPVFPCPALDQPFPAYQSCPAPDRIYAVCYPQAMPLRQYRTAQGHQYYRWREISMREYDLDKQRFPDVSAADWPGLTEAMGVELGNA
jgi:hypothetical protein